jgi:hypothetical protein
MPRALELINQSIPTPASKSTPITTQPPVANPVQSTPAKAPTAPARPSVKAPAAVVSDYSLGDVITMQNLIISLSMTMTKNIDNISKKTKLTPDQVRQYAISFNKMGRRNNAPADGVWGPNTNNVLQNINNFLQAIGSNLKVELGEGNQPFKGDVEKLKQLAANNVTVINSIFGEIGVARQTSSETPNKTNIGERGELDRIKKTLTWEDANDPNSFGDLFVKPDDLGNLWNFYLLIQKLSADFFTKCEPLDTYLAAPKTKKQTATEPLPISSASLEILNGSIYRLAQGTSEENVSYLTQDEVPNTDGVCLGFFDKVLDWFKKRSNTIYTAAKSESKEKLALAEAYRNAISRLIPQWIIFRKYIIKSITDSGRSDYPYITDEIFFNATQNINSDSKDGKLGRPHGQLVDSRFNRDTGVRQDSGKGEDKLVGPIQTTMDLGEIVSERGYRRYLSEATLEAAKQIKNNSTGGSLPTLVASEWMYSGNWKSLADDYINAETNVEAQRKFVPYMNLIKQFLYSVLRDWLRHPSIETKIPKENKSAERLILSNWSRYIDALIGEAEYAQRNPGGNQGRKWTGAF